MNYQVIAGKTFLVSGSQAGFITTATLPTDGTCAPNPTPDVRFSFRIPMDAQPCTNVDPNVVSKIDGRLDPDAFTQGSSTMATVADRAGSW